MKPEYKIVEAIRAMLVAAEQDYDPEEPSSAERDAYVDGLQAAYNVASKIADGF